MNQIANELKPMSKIKTDHKCDIDSAKKYCEEVLEKMVGMNSIKDSINTLLDRVYIQSLRSEYGLKSIKSELNLIFSGNPGTGKTSVARVLGLALKHMGIVSSGHTVEVTRKDLVAQHIGATALKTQAVIEKAVGGVLFIDEAYSLDASNKSSDFASEAIETLMVAMENHRDDLVVIVAGYPDKIKSFVESNPGLKSRFSRTIVFQDFTEEELIIMSRKVLEENDYEFSESSLQILEEKINLLKKRGFFAEKNGRGIRLFIDSIIEEQSKRLVRDLKIDKKSLKEIKPEDILLAVETAK